ncbi:hypothetical protein VOLCADRAFT_105864 [Volvox carteri f. nagariensis]|uniref:Uncharacterized protein n=1 Tax=Volvox carteri f. nagariensis TaxID=3068 RepID=D8U3S0_VOLCA|nr:uncharacterized protein VOLCADRAFT_105864 [Volvox carteri f. nagariensis]EFJ45659.1 hypothetical protein VOLCADRAFT_105864 [Volvox carteri f. nagariensis]|eukprot:XP_002953349.1 hypothetical protein VOLCADRAFT_105864 [Volvox carteri f. nagariensis]
MLATLLGGLELADCALSLLKPNHPQLGAAQRAWLLAAENEVTRDAICEADMTEAMWAKGYGPQLGCLWRLLERVDDTTAIGSSDCPERARKGTLGIDPSRIGSDEGSRGTEGEPETKTLTLELDGEDAGTWCDPEEDALLLFFKKVPVANNPQTEIALPAPPETDLPRAAEQLNRAWLGITAATLAETPDTQLMQEATFEQEVRIWGGASDKTTQPTPLEVTP